MTQQADDAPATVEGLRNQLARSMRAALETAIPHIDAAVAASSALSQRRQAVMSPATVDEARRTVELVWSTGAPVQRFGWRPDNSIGDWVEELSLDEAAIDLTRLNGGAPLLDTHSNWDLGDIIGVVESARIEGGRGIARVRFSERDEVEAVWRDVKAGIIRNVSVGYQVDEWQSMAADGASPKWRALRWTPYELSLVPIPADAGAQVRAAGATRKAQQAERSAATKGDEMTAKAITEPAAANAAGKTNDAPPAVDLEALRRDAVGQERARIAAIQRFEDRLGRDWAKKHLDEGTPIDAVRDDALERLMAAEAKAPTSSVRAEVVDDGRDRFMRGASHWLTMRAGVAQMAAKGEKLEPGEFRGMSLLDLARHSLELSGVSTRGMDRSELAGLALTHRSNINQGTGDFPILLGNVMHKVLLGAYDLFPMTWNRWCATGSVSDFRAHNRYRLGSIANLQTVAEFGEVPFEDIPDGERQTITASTKGIRVSLSRQALINDDMQAFNQVPTQLGQAAARSIEAAVYAMLLENAGLGPTMSDALAFFDAGHSNIGTAAAYAVASIDSDISVMRVQTGPNGEKINLRPAVVVVPVSLRGTAQLVNNNTTDPTASKSSTTANIVAGAFRDVIDTPYLTGTRRYLFADPAQAAAFEVAFLEGQAQPMLESQPGWSTLGVEWRIVHDWGVAALDYRAGVTNAGQ